MKLRPSSHILSSNLMRSRSGRSSLSHLHHLSARRKPRVHQAQRVRVRFSTASGSDLKIWENPMRQMSGKPYFQALVFPDRDTCTIIGVSEGELQVGIDVPRNQGNRTLLPFLLEAFGLSGDEYQFVISSAYKKKRRKWIRLERVDGEAISLSEFNTIFSGKGIQTIVLESQPDAPEQPKD